MSKKKKKKKKNVCIVFDEKFKIETPNLISSKRKMALLFYRRLRLNKNRTSRINCLYY